jgi:hypothetical protein
VLAGIVIDAELREGVAFSDSSWRTGGVERLERNQIAPGVDRRLRLARIRSFHRAAT